MSDNVNLNILLYEPQIPQNTGNIGRLCVGINARLHLVKPYGFELSEKKVRRAGLDYWPHLKLSEYDAWEPKTNRTFLFSKKATKSIFDIEFEKGDWLVFGAETTGLPSAMMETHADKCCILPMFGEIRSHNLANSVSAAAYLALNSIHKNRCDLAYDEGNLPQ
jgi:tRNA (cytidine/uridine-2'-O-)-methyltransferase